MKLSGIGHAIGDVFEHTGRKITKVAEAPGTRKGFKSLLGLGAAGGVFYGVTNMFGATGKWVQDNPVKALAIGGAAVYVVSRRA